MSTIEEWNIQYQNTVKALQEVNRLINERIVGIRGGQDRRMFSQMHLRNQKTLRTLLAEHEKLKQSLNMLSRGSLQPKETQFYASRLDKLYTELQNAQERVQMTDEQILDDGRFYP